MAPLHTPFQTILNFRDVGQKINTSVNTNLMKTGKLYRGARPDEASPEDRRKLVNDYGIKNIIDLRTKTEHIQAAQKRDAKIKSSAAIPQTNDAAAEPLKIPGVTYHEINFNGKGFEKMLISRTSWAEFGKIVGLMAFGYRLEAISVLGPKMVESGLQGLATDSLDVCGKEVCETFTILAEPSNWPILIHCTQGKDRTGLIVILVLFLLGASTEAVMEDYMLSEPELLPEKASRMKEIQSIGLTEHFATCPEDLVKRVHQHIVDRYGSVMKYLLGVGVTLEMQERIKGILAA